MQLAGPPTTWAPPTIGDWMKFLTRINTRWTGEQLVSWSSVSKTIYVLFPLLIYFIAGDVIEFFLWMVLNAIVGQTSEAVREVMSAYSYSIEGFIYAIGLVVSLALIRKSAIAEISYVPEGEEKPVLKISEIILLIGIALVSSLGLNYLFSIVGIKEASESYQRVSDAQYGVNFVFGTFLYGVMSPIAEEVIFRGIMYNRMKRIFPRGLAFVLSALLFGIFHWNLVQGIYGFLMGLLIVFCYEKFKSFWAPVIVHVVANLGVYIISSLF